MIKRALKFIGGFFGILLGALVILAVIGYFNQDKQKELPPKNNVAESQTVS